MGRPKTVNFKTFHEYNLLHTEKVKMYCGVYMTALYPIKETEQFYRSIEVWANYASVFKRKKKGFTLSVNIPTITDKKTIEFLNKEAWHDWTSETSENPDVKETLAMLDKLFPNHKKSYFYELDSILSFFAYGSLVKYDADGNVVEPSEHDIERRKYLTHKYNKYNLNNPEIKAAFEEYLTADSSDEIKKQKFKIYYDLNEDFAYKNHCLDDVFISIGQNGVCYPVAFSDNTAEWSKEKYGKLIGYAHAGEILFVVTPDSVFFEIKRHF